MTLGKPHINHGSDNAAVEVLRVLQNVRERARSHPNDPLLRVVQDVCGSIQNEEVVMRLPSRQAILRNINRLQNQSRPRNPQSLNELLIYPPYDVTINGQAFLQYDTGLVNSNVK